MPGAVFLSGAVCETEDVFQVHNCAKSLVDQAMFCHVAVQFLSLVRDNLCIQRCCVTYPLPFLFSVVTDCTHVFLFVLLRVVVLVIASCNWLHFEERTTRIGHEPKREPPVVCEPDWRASRSIAPGRDGHTMFGVPTEWTNAPCVPVCSANFFPELFGWSDSVLFGTRADNNDSVAPSQGVMFLRAWRSRTGHISGFVVSKSPMRPYSR